MPDKKLVLVERLTSRDRFPAVLSGSPEQVLRSYLVESAGLDRVAGRECQQWLFKPRDELRYAYRLCTDVASGLLLRAQTLDAQHRLIEQVSFTELRIGGGINRDELKPRWNTEGWTVRESQVVPIDLGSSGWTLPDVAGFRRTLELRRPLGDRGDVIQVVMSDGLSSLSLFIEPMDTGSALPEGASQAGVVNMYRRKSSQHWITAVGEVPTQTLQRTVEALQHRAPTR
jgi:sigma-E factor negative regulatory protein RseB